MMKKWEAKLPGGKKIVFESDTPREYMRDVGHDEYALTQIAQVPSANVSAVRHGKWRYYHKQNISVCTERSF